MGKDGKPAIYPSMQPPAGHCTPIWTRCLTCLHQHPSFGANAAPRWRCAVSKRWSHASPSRPVSSVFPYPPIPCATPSPCIISSGILANSEISRTSWGMNPWTRPHYIRNRPAMTSLQTWKGARSMSATSELSAGLGVLQYTASRPAVLLSPQPSDEELAFDWTLSECDIAFILTNHRGPENLCRLAVQLCVLRKHGRFLAHYLQVSPAVLGYLCRQLDLPPLVALSGPVRGNTESDYQRDIAQYLGWRPFDAQVHTWLREWIVEQVVQHLYVEDLVEQASERLRTHRIVLPGRTVFERTVNAAHADAEHRIFAHLTQHLSAATTEAMDRLLG